MPNSLGAGSLWRPVAIYPALCTCRPKKASLGMSRCSLARKKVGGRENGWFQSQEISLLPQPGLSIQASLLMETQGVWGERAAFPGCVRKLPCAEPTASCRLWGPILEASSGCFLVLSASQPVNARHPQFRADLHSSPITTARWDPGLGAGKMISMGLIKSDSL